MQRSRIFSFSHSPFSTGDDSIPKENGFAPLIQKKNDLGDQNFRGISYY